MYLRILLLLAFIAGFEPAFVSADEPDWSQFNTLVDEAEIIFRGTVISKEYRDDLEHGGSPFTFYTFDIQEEYKG